MDKAQISNFKIHDLRHSFASMAVNSGATLYVVQHLLGHASPQTTQRYAHLQDKTLLAASENIASLMLTKQQA
jgi:site-specific recombinase XerD